MAGDRDFRRLERAAATELRGRAVPAELARRRQHDGILRHALVELAAHGLDARVSAGRGSQRPHLQVTASLETLLGAVGAPAGDLERGGPISFAAVQRLACDSSITRILVRPDSAVMDVGRARRTPSVGTRKAVAHRDRRPFATASEPRRRRSAHRTSKLTC